MLVLVSADRLQDCLTRLAGRPEAAYWISAEGIARARRFRARRGRRHGSSPTAKSAEPIVAATSGPCFAASASFTQAGSCASGWWPAEPSLPGIGAAAGREQAGEHDGRGRCASAATLPGGQARISSGGRRPPGYARPMTRLGELMAGAVVAVAPEDTLGEAAERMAERRRRIRRRARLGPADRDPHGARPARRRRGTRAHERGSRARMDDGGSGDGQRGHVRRRGDQDDARARLPPPAGCRRAAARWGSSACASACGPSCTSTSGPKAPSD